MFGKGTEKIIQCGYRDLPKMCKPNDVLYLDDGKIIALVTDVEHVRFNLSNTI